MGDHAEQQGMHFDPATMQMFQAFAVFMQQQHATERREILATKAIQAVVNKMDQFAGKDVTKYLCKYVKEMELHRVSEGIVDLMKLRNLLKPYVHNPEHILDAEQIVLPKQSIFELQLDYILDTRERKLRNRSIIEHLVKWKDYPEEDATWEDETTLQKDYIDIRLR
ncbi:hypothetical protein L7F22_048255 [Adiantum nelumboides]|nr:hypothetical protein [Adiantum nelumboides]